MIDFERALVTLADVQVRFVIVGGLAVTIHGSAYVTFDLDLCYARDTENLARLASVLQPFNPRLRGAPAELPFRFDEETLRRGLNFILSTELGDLDLLGEVTGIMIRTRKKISSKALTIYGEHLPALITLGLETGMRLGELLNARWGDIKQDQTLYVPFTKTD